MESLHDKLNSLGLVPAARVAKPQIKSTQPPLEEIIPGEVISNSLGTCYLTRMDYPLGYHHGKVKFSELIPTSEIVTISKKVEKQVSNPDGLFFLDTETTGLSGGTGTLAFLVGIGYQCSAGFRVDQFLLRDPTEEPSMLLELANFSERSSIISTYNGKAFDLPLLNSRYTINRLQQPFSHLNHLDLLHLARRIWKNRLPSRALQDLEREILDLPRDENEVPGWMIPEIYFNYQRTGDPSPLAGVIYHNRMDILSLAALMIFIGDVMNQIHLEKLDLHLTDLYSMAVIYHDAGLLAEAENLFLRCLHDRKMDPQFIPGIYKYLGELYKHQGKWDKAVNIWEISANQKDLDSAVELAKYYEHHELDFDHALFWTLKAMEDVDSIEMPRYKKRNLINELQLREIRLKRLSLKREAGKLDEQ